LDRNLFTEGVLPAINIGLSVSRVGSAAQILAMKKVAGSLKLELAQYREVKDFIKFGSDLNDETLQLIKKGRLLTELLKQKRFSPVSPEKQTVVLFAGLNGFFEDVAIGAEFDFTNNLFNFVENSFFFKPNFSLLISDSYFKEFGLSFLRTAVEFFTFYKLGVN
jgi:F0F1-type ATP synthase alpha subunit